MWYMLTFLKIAISFLLPGKEFLLYSDLSLQNEWKPSYQQM